jgi:hypothetical protein
MDDSVTKQPPEVLEVGTAKAASKVQRNSPTKRCVVVLGSGRSGTSAAIRMLHALGVNVSDELRPTQSEQNPEGNWEDDAIVSRHQALLKSLDARIYQPLPDGWETTPEATEAIKDLRSIIRQRMAEADNNWVFKDPRTAVLLPLWIRVFNTEKIVPTYVFAVRHPAAAISSMWKQYLQDPVEAEFIWLLRNLAAITHTGGRLFTLHYEALLEKPAKTAADLARYCGLEASDAQIEQASQMIDRGLDRASVAPQPLHLASTARLHEALKRCHGRQFDRRALEVATEITSEIKAYKTWIGRERRPAPNAEATKDIASLKMTVDHLSGAKAQLTGELAGIKALATTRMDQVEKAVAGLASDQRRLSAVSTELDKELVGLRHLRIEQTMAELAKELRRLAAADTALDRELAAMRPLGAQVIELKNDTRQLATEIRRLDQQQAEIKPLQAAMLEARENIRRLAEGQGALDKGFAEIKRIEATLAQLDSDFHRHDKRIRTRLGEIEKQIELLKRPILQKLWSRARSGGDKPLPKPET